MVQFDEQTRKQNEKLVAEQYCGILPQCEAFYIHSIIYAANQSEAAFARFQNAIDKGEDAGSVMAAIQEAISHASALSRFFWPMERNAKARLAAARGRRLRDAFDVSDSSPLKERRLRNGFEHFDEDLDQFLLQNQVGHFFPNPIVDNHALSDEPVTKIFKLVDPEHSICVVLGNKFEFRDIRSEVGRILDLALSMDRQGCRL